MNEIIILSVMWITWGYSTKYTEALSVFTALILGITTSAILC